MFMYTCDLGYREGEANGGVGKRHDGCDNGEPRELVEVWYLAQNDLNGRKYRHEWIV